MTWMPLDSGRKLEQRQRTNIQTLLRKKKLVILFLEMHLTVQFNKAQSDPTKIVCAESGAQLLWLNNRWADFTDYRFVFG